MAREILSVEGVSKQYRLGVIGTGTLSHDLNRWWHRMRGLPDPYAEIGQENAREIAGGDYVWALKDVSFSVNEGDVLGIIGKNGAGKSTLLKLLARVTSPTKGRISYEGRIASLLEVGTGFHPELTGRENIYLNGAILGMTKAEISAKLEEIVEFSGVAKYIDTPSKRYSSGMTVRLGFAIAAHLEPEILIVDEVLAVGDADFQERCIRKMKSISETGRTILFVSHNMTSVSKLCNRGIILNRGTIEFEDTNIENVTNRYLDSAFTDVEVSELKNREGTGNIRLSQFHVLDASDMRVNSVKSGQRLKIRLRFDNFYGYKISEGVEIRVIFRNKDNFALSMLYSRTAGIDFEFSEGPNEFEVEIPKLPFSKDNLYIDVAIRYKNVIEDRVSGIAKIHVVEGDFFPGADFLHPEFFRGVFIDHTWRKTT